MASSSRRSLVSRAGAAARKVVARQPAPAGKKATAKKATTPKAPAKKQAKPATAASPTRTGAAKKGPAKKGTAKKVAAKKAPVEKAPVEKAPARKVAAKKAPAKTASSVTKAAPPTKATAKRGSKATATKTTTATAASATTAAASVQPVTRKTAAGRLVVRAGEEPWTKAELAEVRTQLKADVKRLNAELQIAEDDLVGLMRSSGDGAGNDQADVGSASFERDQELTIANNAREMLVQSQHALERIGDGSYGVCEVCGEPIGKNRLMVFPRATMCVTCKQREERR